MNKKTIKTILKGCLFSVVLLVSQNVFSVATKENLSSLTVGILQEIAHIFTNQHNAKEQKRFKTMVLEDAQKLSDLNHQNIAVMRERITLADLDANSIDQKLAEIDSNMKRFISYIKSSSAAEWGMARKLIKDIDKAFIDLKNDLSKIIAKESGSKQTVQTMHANVPADDMQVIGVAVQEDMVTHAEGVTGVEFIPTQEGEMSEPLLESLDFNDVN